MSTRSWKEFRKSVHVMDSEILNDILKHYDESLSSTINFLKEDMNSIRKKKQIVLNELSHRN